MPFREKNREKIILEIVMCIIMTNCLKENKTYLTNLFYLFSPQSSKDCLKVGSGVH